MLMSHLCIQRKWRGFCGMLLLLLGHHCIYITQLSSGSFLGRARRSQDPPQLPPPPHSWPPLADTHTQLTPWSGLHCHVMVSGDHLTVGGARPYTESAFTFFLFFCQKTFLQTNGKQTAEITSDVSPSKKNFQFKFVEKINILFGHKLSFAAGKLVY